MTEEGLLHLSTEGLKCHFEWLSKLLNVIFMLGLMYLLRDSFFYLLTLLPLCLLSDGKLPYYEFYVNTMGNNKEMVLAFAEYTILLLSNCLLLFLAPV